MPNGYIATEIANYCDAPSSLLAKLLVRISHAPDYPADRIRGLTVKTETQPALVPGQVYHPWVGRHFSVSNPRILFLGHSHYGDDPLNPDPNLTNSLVCGHLKDRRDKFLTLIARLGTGLPAHEIDQHKFFERIAFMNLLQGTLEAPRMKASAADLERGAAVLVILLRHLKPTHIVIFGEQVWDALNNAGHFTIGLKGEPYFSGSIETIPTFYSNHPSSYGFSPDKWASQFNAFLRDRGVNEKSLEQWIGATRFVTPESKPPD
ncbi:MAG: hypothetical protein K5905_22190 [Roseibium sp.]|uniref:hypothetical protein n=1 Tax=Roseibium sp. TaxID=1936156 RepID=UPI0026163DB5|nr:hypothetical protein [Roseibium sp.]MCV0428176.1 hypothetical protein [Roseibium sp.]